MRRFERIPIKKELYYEGIEAELADEIEGILEEKGFLARDDTVRIWRGDFKDRLGKEYTNLFERREWEGWGTFEIYRKGKGVIHKGKFQAEGYFFRSGGIGTVHVKTISIFL